MTCRKHAKKSAPPPPDAADLLRDLAALEAWNAARRLKERGMPEGWGDLARRLPARPARMRVSIPLDADVADWFEALDPVSSEALNAALRIYVLGVLSREIDAP